MQIRYRRKNPRFVHGWVDRGRWAGNVEEQGKFGGNSVVTENLRINCGKREDFGTHCILRTYNIHQVLIEGNHTCETRMTVQQKRIRWAKQTNKQTKQ